MIAGVLTTLIGNVDTIENVIATMRAIEVALPERDGVRWFNRRFEAGEALSRLIALGRTSQRLIERRSASGSTAVSSSTSSTARAEPGREAIERSAIGRAG